MARGCLTDFRSPFGRYTELSAFLIPVAVMVLRRLQVGCWRRVRRSGPALAAGARRRDPVFGLTPGRTGQGFAILSGCCAEMGFCAGSPAS